MLNFNTPEPDYPIPDYLYEGQEVIVSVIHDGKCKGLRCKVIAAHGNHGRIANEAYNYDRLISRWDMRIKKGK